MFIDDTYATSQPEQAMCKIDSILKLALLAVSLLLAACSNTPAPTLNHLPNDAVILAFGDSLTAGIGAKETQSYPAILERSIARVVINAGVAGEETTGGLKRLPALLNSTRPDLVLLCHGGNDLLRKRDKQKIKDNLRSMIKLIQSSGAEVLVIGVPEPKLLMRSTEDLYIELADELNIPLEGKILDKVLAKNEFKSDQVHPNGEGYKMVATAIERSMRDFGAL